MYPVAAPWVLSVVGAVQLTKSLALVPSGGGATAVIDGAFGANGPEAVVSVLPADHALVPATFAPWIRTSVAAPAARPDRTYGLVTFDACVQTLAPEGLDCRLNTVAALCVLSTAGAVQVTVRPLPGPCASDGAAGAFGIAVPVVSVVVVDHGLVPAAFALWIWTSIAVPAGRPDRRCGLVTFANIVQTLAPEGLDCRLNTVAALCVLSTAGAVQVTTRSLLEPAAREGACGAFGSRAVGVGVGIGIVVGVSAVARETGIMTAGARTPGVGGYIDML